MLDPYVILAPLFLLPIAGMLRFIGCTFPDIQFATPNVFIVPEGASLFPNEQQQFTALDENGTPIAGVIWLGSANLASDGLYTAPEPFDPGHTSETVTANDPATNLNASAPVTLKSSSVTVTPPSVTLLPGAGQEFKASVAGPDQTVTWSIDPPGPGVVTSTGTNTANYTFAGPYQTGLQPVKVRATSEADPSQSGSATVTLIGNAAQFVPPLDTVTQGNWKNIYGQEGWALAGVPFNLPSYLLALDFSSLSVFTWEDPTLDPRGLQKPPTFDYFAAAWYNSNPLATVFELNFDFEDYKTHRVAIYCVDWFAEGRAQTFEFFDDSTGPPALLDTQALSGFSGGQYLVWELVGQVRLKVTKTAGPNLVISGIFFE